MRVELIHFANGEELASSVAAEWLQAVNPANRRSEACFNVALSGGRIARMFFTAASAQARASRVSLNSVRFFWADERCVPPGDAESNFRVANELLFKPLQIPDAQVFRIPGEAPPAFAAAKAEAELCRMSPLDSNGQPLLDLILLGLGEDGHVASLFPGEAETVMASPAAYRPVTAPKFPPRRITLGYQAIAAARQVWVLASGPGKELALRESLAPDDKTPLARVLRARSVTRVYTDIRRD